MSGTSSVGVDQVPELDYYRAKTLQEDILKAGPVPYSIVRATQFMEFIDTVLSWTADDHTVRLPRTRLQPVAAADVAATVAEVAAGTPLRGTLELAGPDAYPLDELGLITLRAKGDSRSVTTDDTAGMFAAVNGDVLTPKGSGQRPNRPHPLYRLAGAERLTRPSGRRPPCSASRAARERAPRRLPRLLVPRLAALAALGLVGVMLGAEVFTWAFLGGVNWATPLIAAAFLGAVAYGRRHTLTVPHRR